MKKWPPALALVALLTGGAWGGDARPAWPGFLPPRDSLPAELAAAVGRTWTEATFTRTVQARAAGIPFDLYAALVDTPDVTAAAARHRDIARHEVWLVGDDLYQATDHDGSDGFYRVLARDRERRVIFSWGEHSGSLLGTIRGDALTVLRLEAREGAVEQTLTAHVRIANQLAAFLARVLLAIFGGIADRKLNEGFTVATQVAEWAVTRPDEFCQWLARSRLPAERRRPVQSLVAGCP
jgi:hypothetical protein